ncbi:NAD-dependent epimerase [Komagataeibacter intermedius]|uniref:UDP-glucuronate 5-epimerase n=2 Tax=Komagataeibacter intermedius TaxID=66229 RepID=A0A0N1FE49_9PROT|nr:NAD-dependent epimerase [Komagataeibacter intermedius]KPH88821.1 UDP-glucuronate 5-epimerase [Komagataeibacter intermedius AF2]MCF3635300.1 NAD-dependent epimerase [Komagataeibacter intermedius]GAN87510.1 UDP-N-acetylglucosamine 4-epimerase [Komagataeibacter intermedius TF2]GBQ67713.1 UDP-N-acetylglucosamine 4-epimerase [Komagataeibacter intermedius NRIC 0521]
MRILVTGTAGFIGFHLARRLLRDGHDVTGIDGMTSYYDVRLKQKRHAMLREFERFTCNEFMLEDAQAMENAFTRCNPELVVHLAAQAGVRYSIENPGTYISANLIGTYNVLEQARRCQPAHLMIASTSSVYGASRDVPFSESQRCDHPLSLYAATKKATEELAHSYSHIWKLPVTAFRFFTVYGPWGRPDMALFKFTANTLAGKPIDVYNNGNMERDFTYIDDLVEAICLLSHKPPHGPGESDPGASPVAPYRVINIGNSHPVSLMAFIEAIEKALGQPCIRNYMPMQPGDVPRTWADCSALQALTGFRPATPVQTGVNAFVEWYRQYYHAPQTTIAKQQ